MNSETDRPPEDMPTHVVNQQVIHRLLKRDAKQNGNLPCDFANYELLEEIARGGMGVVYKARQKSLNRIVALKMILAGSLASELDVQRFYQEAEAVAQLKHPHIIDIYEIGQVGEQHFFSMEFIEGADLAYLLKQGPVSPNQIAEWICNAADAVAHAHSQGILHRDLKPQNIMIDAENQPRVMDFGLAKRINQESELTATGAILGTPTYMSPEQATSHRADEVGPGSDVYALGAILFRAFTGQPPFRGETPFATMLEVINADVPSPQTLKPDLPKDLETICLKCLAKDIAQRYLSATELAEDLERYLNHEPILAKPPNPLQQAIRWARRKPLLAVTYLGLSLLYSVLLLTYFVFIPEDKKPVEFHGIIGGIVGTAVAVTTCVQWMIDREQFREAAYYLLTTAMAILPTIAFVFDHGLDSAPMPLYLILIGIPAVFNPCVQLIVYACTLSIACYLTVVLSDLWLSQRETVSQLFGERTVPDLEQVLAFVVCQLMMCLMMCLLVRRLRIADRSSKPLRGSARTAISLNTPRRSAKAL